MKINIKDQEFELKQTFRTAMLFESITGESFGQTTSTYNFLLFFYCNVVGSKRGLNLTFDEFIDYIDDNQDKIVEFSNWLQDNNKVGEMTNTKEEDTKSVKKNKKR